LKISNYPTALDTDNWDNPPYGLPMPPTALSYKNSVNSGYFFQKWDSCLSTKCNKACREQRQGKVLPFLNTKDIDVPAIELVIWQQCLATSDRMCRN
jgi:hypothetical protein